MLSSGSVVRMNYFTDLGDLDPPRHPDSPSTDASRGHQGTRSSGSSRIRRRERKAAARDAEVTIDTAENVEETDGESMEKADEWGPTCRQKVVELFWMTQHFRVLPKLAEWYF